jgi:hypothetical protein
MFQLKSSPSSIFPSFLYNPWLYFFTFSIANIILSYAESAPRILLLITSLYLFILTMMAMFFLLKNTSPNRPLYLEETIPTLSPTWFCIVLFLALLPRIYILFNSTWPLPDDGLNTFVSVTLSKKWSWHLFFTQVQIPPLNNWIQAFYFKLISPSICSMRFFYFILSIAAVFLSFFTSRFYASRSMTFFCFTFIALGFWPLYASRFCTYPQPLFTFQIMVLGILGIYLKSRSVHEYQVNGLKLGFVTGLGFWVAIQWPLIAVMILIAVFFKTKTKLKKSIPFGIALLLLTIPFLAASLLQKNGEHIKYLLTLPLAEGVTRLNSFCSNWTSLFWGCNLQNSYGPVWGGMLNPIAGSLFFIGFIELIRTISNGLSRWIFYSFFIFMIPGFITSSFDIFRNSLVLPLSIFICAIGIQSLIKHTSLFWKPFILALILLFSSSLDMIHLWKTYQPVISVSNNSTNNIEFSKAFQLLKEVDDQKGPGELFWGFNTDIDDTTLDIATYGFNAAENPKLSFENAQWAAFITNANYKNFISNQYPNAKFYWLGKDTFWNQGGLMMILIFKEEKNKLILRHWKEVNDLFHSSTDDYFLNPLVSQEMPNYKKFSGTEKFIKGDRFLESVFYEKLIYFQRKNSNRQELMTLIKTAIQKGYPAAHLFVTEGLLWRAEGNYPEAEKAFKKALHSRLNLTDAEKNLEILNLLIRGLKN